MKLPNRGPHTEESFTMDEHENVSDTTGERKHRAVGVSKCRGETSTWDFTNMLVRGSAEVERGAKRQTEATLSAALSGSESKAPRLCRGILTICFPGQEQTLPIKAARSVHGP